MACPQAKCVLLAVAHQNKPGQRSGKIYCETFVCSLYTRMLINASSWRWSRMVCHRGPSISTLSVEFNMSRYKRIIIKHRQLGGLNDVLPKFISTQNCLSVTLFVNEVVADIIS